MHRRARVQRLALFCLLAAAASSGCSKRSLYYEDGTKRSEGRLTWGSGREEGSWSYWYPNGERRDWKRWNTPRGVWWRW